MKKTLILSLGLVMAFGLTGCTSDKPTIKPIIEIVEKEIIEKPLMILGDDINEEAVVDVLDEVVAPEEIELSADLQTLKELQDLQAIEAINKDKTAIEDLELLQDLENL